MLNMQFGSTSYLSLIPRTALNFTEAPANNEVNRKKKGFNLCFVRKLEVEKCLPTEKCES